MEFEEITKTIIGCAYTVYNKMGFGFLESVYEKCLIIELEKAGLHFKSQQQISVHYNEKEVGYFTADLLVNGVVIVELKSVHALTTAHEIQLVNYLVATGIAVGLLINFGEKNVEIRRKLKTLPNCG